MKRKKSLVVIAIAVFLMNTICFAATTATSTKNISVSANLNDYNCSANKIRKNNSFNHADLSNITGAYQQMGTSFSIYVKQDGVSFTSRKVTVSNEHITNVSMLFDGLTTQQITEKLTGKYFLLYAKLLGYPRVNPATISGYLVP